MRLRAYHVGQNVLGQWVAWEGSSLLVHQFDSFVFGVTAQEALTRLMVLVPPEIEPDWDPLWNERGYEAPHA